MTHSETGAGQTNDLLGQQPPYTLTVDHTIKAPRDVVWNVWTSTAFWVEALGGPRIRITDPFFDIRPGGSFHHGVVNMGLETRVHGQYFTVQEPDLIVYSFVWENLGDEQDLETHIRLRFLEQSGATTITVEHSKIPSASVHDLFRELWLSLFKRVTRRLESKDGDKAAPPTR